MVLIDQYQIQFWVRSDLERSETERIAQTLNDVKFRRMMRQALVKTIRQFPVLSNVRMRLTR